MNSPEDIPEDREESYPCYTCGDGNMVLLHEPGMTKPWWVCDHCGWSPPCKEEDE
jgi:predicted RNA-binding Zn-ribbon protein involved in translation (DUF1610 family)